MTKDNLVAFLLFAVATIGFFVWGYEYIPSNHFLLFSIATLFGLFMAFNIGGNDVANAFGTSVGAKTITLKQALVIAAIFELSGAIFAGGEVTKTIRQGIVSMPTTEFDPMLFVVVMLSALLSAGLWLLFASKKGLPVSTTHSIVGGIVGGSLALGWVVTNGESSFSMVQWSKIGQIAISWVLSPLLGGMLSYCVFYVIKTKILEPSEKAAEIVKRMKKDRKAYKIQYTQALADKSEAEQIEALKHLVIHDEDELNDANMNQTDYQKRMKEMKRREKNINPFAPIRMYLPFVAAIAAITISSMLLFKGLNNLQLGITTIQNIWIIFLIGTGAFLSVLAIVNVMSTKGDVTKLTNKIFSWLQIFTASSFAFSHGANDIANAIGPFAAILDVLKTGMINASAPVPFIAMVAFGVSLVVGLWFLGKEVITTVGSRLTEIRPTTGFSAEISATIVILLATVIGLPVSSTHILIGAVLGIGILNKNANWKLMSPIALAWVITLPIAALSSAIFFFVLRMLMGV